VEERSRCSAAYIRLAAVNSLLLARTMGQMQRAAAADVMPVKRRHDTIDRPVPQTVQRRLRAQTDRLLSFAVPVVSNARSIFTVRRSDPATHVWCCVIPRLCALIRESFTALSPHTQTSKLPQQCMYPEEASAHVHSLEEASLELHVSLQCLSYKVGVRTPQLWPQNGSPLQPSMSMLQPPI
jgi:hypothetical protein